MQPVIPSWDELRLVMPEIWLVLSMCAVILVPFVKRSSVLLPTVTAFVGLMLALVSTLDTLEAIATAGTNPSVFSGMLVIDPFSQFFKLMLIAFTALVVVQWWMGSRNQTHEHDVPDFHCLLLGAAFGMTLMASANNLLMIVIAMESASLPSFALAGFRKRNRIASEGSLKYVVFGAAASAVMIYGMSLIYMVTGTLNLTAIAASATQSGVSPLLAIGVTALLIGIAFKLSVVPMHFWCPDVFQGAPIEVTTFLSVASKGAAIALLIRILTTFGPTAAAPEGGTMFVGLGVGVAIIGAITASWGNLVALHQTNIKRLLAYSSIAHAGYMVMAASLIVESGGGIREQHIVGAILFYLFIYLFMNLGAFTVASMIHQQTGSEDIRSYANMIRRSPSLAILLTLFLLSLFGMPGLGGFMGKIFLMELMTHAGMMGYVLITVLLLNTLVSLYYYMRPVYYMVFTPDPDGQTIVVPRGAAVAMMLVCAAALLWTGIIPGVASDLTRSYATLHTPRLTAAGQVDTARDIASPVELHTLSQSQQR